MSVRPIHAVRTRFALVIVAVAIAATGCARKTRTPVPAPASPRAPSPTSSPTSSQTSSPPSAKIGATETGMASWYGEPYHGRRAASGEIYDMEQFTAAHRTLPFDTWVEVTDLDNGRKVEVRVTDRGPFVDNRIIDLSLAAARRLDMLGPGTARVRLKVIAVAQVAPAASPLPDSGIYAVQAGAFSDRGRAEAVAASVHEQSKDTSVIQTTLRGQTVWRVLIARNLPLDEANRLAAKVREATGAALVVKNP